MQAKSRLEECEAAIERGLRWGRRDRRIPPLLALRPLRETPDRRAALWAALVAVAGEPTAVQATEAARIAESYDVPIGGMLTVAAAAVSIVADRLERDVAWRKSLDTVFGRAAAVARPRLKPDRYRRRYVAKRILNDLTEPKTAAELQATCGTERRALKELVASGHVTVERRGRAFVYVLAQSRPIVEK